MVVPTSLTEKKPDRDSKYELVIYIFRTLKAIAEFTSMNADFRLILSTVNKLAKVTIYDDFILTIGD